MDKKLECRRSVHNNISNILLLVYCSTVIGGALYLADKEQIDTKNKILLCGIQYKDAKLIKENVTQDEKISNKVINMVIQGELNDNLFKAYVSGVKDKEHLLSMIEYINTLENKNKLEKKEKVSKIIFHAIAKIQPPKTSPDNNNLLYRQAYYTLKQYQKSHE